MQKYAFAALMAVASAPLLPMPAAAQSVGHASFYGKELAGRKTASGERFSPGGMTAAHRSLAFGTRLKLTNIRNGRSVVVRINDRGPFVRGRVLDVSLGAAQVLGFVANGTAQLRIEPVGGPRATPSETAAQSFQKVQARSKVEGLPKVIDDEAPAHISSPVGTSEAPDDTQSNFNDGNIMNAGRKIPD